MAVEFCVSKHPLIKHKISHMRRHHTEVNSREYTRLMRELGMLLAYEATAEFYTELKSFFRENEDSKIRKPTMMEVIYGKKPVLIPIIRSGLILYEGVKEVIATTYTGHIGIHNEKKADGRVDTSAYFAAMPDDTDEISERIFYIIDPVINTGTTAITAAELLKKEYGVREEKIRFITLIVTKIAVENLSRSLEDIVVFAGKLDDGEEDVDIISDFDTMTRRMYRSS